MFTCLIVEDSQLNWMIMASQARKVGLRVDICTNGAEALEYCRTKPMPELIFLDGYMPEMDGVGFLKQMRQLPNGHEPFVVFCSASLTREDVGIALDVGAECHFPKPLTRDQIIYAVKQVQQRQEQWLYQS